MPGSALLFGMIRSVSRSTLGPPCGIASASGLNIPAGHKFHTRVCPRSWSGRTRPTPASRDAPMCVRPAYQRVVAENAAGNLEIELAEEASK